MRPLLWRAYLAAALAASIAYFSVPTVVDKDVIYLLLVVSSAVATLATAAARRAGNRVPRLVLGAGLLLWFGGEAFWTTYEVVLRREPPFPSVADAMYLSAYPLFAVALLWLIGGWRANRSAVIEAVAVAAGAGSTIWVVFGDRFFDSTETGLGKLVALGTPVADVILLGILVCAFLLPGRRSPAVRWLLAGVLATLVADAAYSISALDGTYRAGDWLDAGWIGFYVAWGVAALHPSMDEVPIRRPDAVQRYGPRRLVVLIAAGLLPPAALLHEVATGRRIEVPVLSVMSILTFALVAARIAWLWRMADRDAATLAERGGELEAALERVGRLERQRRDLLRATVRATEEERVRVSADIHDGPVQKLTAAALRAGALETRLGASGNQDGKAGVAQIREELTRQIAELRRVIADLRPPELDHGLPAALRELVDAFGRRADTVARLSDDGDGRAEPEVETILFRVTQEALSNVLKHADARSVDVGVRVGRDAASVTIRDDGVGFEPPMNGELVRRGHFGLAGMRERVEAAGGTLSVTSAPGAGSLIEARIPVRSSAA